MNDAPDAATPTELEIRQCVVGPLDTNCYVVSSRASGRAVIIDPGGDAAAVAAAVNGLDVTAILLTHTHFDHVMALPMLVDQCDVPVYAHAAERQVWAHELDYLDRHGHFDAGTTTQALLDSVPGSLAPNGPLWDGQFQDVHAGQTWALDSHLEVAALHTPGHTPGGLTFILPGHLLTGDTLFPGGPGLTGWPLSDFPTIMASVGLLVQYPVSTVVLPGHGPATSIGVERPHLPQWQRRGW